MKISPISVTQLNMYIKEKVAEDDYLKSVFVSGEISNFKHHYTGHMYFTLKDEESLVKCIMFKSRTATLNFVPKDGLKVCVLGSVGVYEKNGEYQIYVDAMKEDGTGSLYEAYEKLKAKLEEEGLFDVSHKKEIPMFPKTIGVLTASTGSVIRDIINVSSRRNPNVHIRLLPVAVQGDGAAQTIVDGIKLMNEKKLADVLIIGRGGGSLEDLWAFNEEIVARAIYDSEIPIISAVGHETDFSISDFVADLRAPTPSAAAELAVPDVMSLQATIDNYEDRLKLALKRKIELMRMQYEKCMNSYVYKDPLKNLNERYITIDNCVKELSTSIMNILNEAKRESSNLITKLDTLSPLKTLIRGYTITEYEGKVISSSKDLKKDMEVDIRFNDGSKKAKVL
ncbi:MAG: exodeoxyribonuclease VII large subunit [Clostridia bacterium]|nr:exodeoxyribonuclease VII large subunit [Clostridia bacterium]